MWDVLSLWCHQWEIYPIPWLTSILFGYRAFCRCPAFLPNCAAHGDSGNGDRLASAAGAMCFSVVFPRVASQPLRYTERARLALWYPTERLLAGRGNVKSEPLLGFLTFYRVCRNFHLNIGVGLLLKHSAYCLSFLSVPSWSRSGNWWRK